MLTITNQAIADIVMVTHYHFSLSELEYSIIVC